MTQLAAGFTFADPDPLLQQFVGSVRRLLDAKYGMDDFRKGILDAAGQLACSGIEMPAECCHCSENGYGRNLVFREEGARFTVLAMVWPHGADTPVHDHGTWCCESVVCGKIQVTPYANRSGNGSLDLHALDPLVLNTGEADCLVPPADLHSVANPFEERAITIHTYGREIDACNVFHPERGEMERLNLCYANV